MRTVVDQLARNHARANQPDGQEPAPVPRAIAVSLIRGSVRLERALDDQVQAELNPNGNQSTDEPTPKRSRNTEDEKLKKKLAAAVLMRDALKRDSSPRSAAAIRRAKRLGGSQPKCRRSMLAVLGLSAMAAIGYHGYNLAFGPAAHADPLAGFSPPIPLEDVEHYRGTFTATAEASWASMSKVERQQRVRELWSDVDMPVAFANAIDINVLSITDPSDTPPAGPYLPQ